MKKEKIQELISQMTLEEKAGMCSGADFWHLKGIERLGIPGDGNRWTSRNQKTGRRSRSSWNQ